MMRTCKACGQEFPLDEFQVVDKKRGYRRHECHSCYKKRHRRYYKDRPEDYAFRADANYKSLRQTIIAAYGSKCACCGEDEFLCLTIDHINNDGAERRRNEHGRGPKFYRWLIANEYPSDFQVLCWNCNIAKYKNGGTCPHKERSTTISSESTPKRGEAHSIPSG